MRRAMWCYETGDVPGLGGGEGEVGDGWSSEWRSPIDIRDGTQTAGSTRRC